MEKKIYRDFDNWWAEGKHEFSSASYDWAKELWDDLEPTITASRDDYKNSYIQLMKEQVKRRTDLTDALLKYIEIHKNPEEQGFWRWWMDVAMAEKD